MLASGGGQLLVSGLLTALIGLNLFKVVDSEATAARGAPETRVPPLRPPVEASVVKPFDLSRGEFKSGHRGIDLAVRSGTVVAAPAPGTVWFAGRVAGLGWVTIQVRTGVLVSVGPLDQIRVRKGGQVGARTPLGTVQPGHGDGVHLGVRVDGRYVDPLPHLAHMGTPRLTPTSNGDAASVTPSRPGWRSRLARLPGVRAERPTAASATNRRLHRGDRLHRKLNPPRSRQQPSGKCPTCGN